MKKHQCAAAMLIGIAATTAATSVRAADVINGQRLYTMHCAACHGASGKSVMPMAPNFARGERLMQPDQALMGAIRTGRNAMPAYIGVLTDREILDVVAFVRTLR